MQDRNPYVGSGVDGCIRSAAIDRSEANTYNSDDPRRDECMASAAEWEAQALRWSTSEDQLI